MSLLPQRFRPVPTSSDLVGTEKPEEICAVPTVPTGSDHENRIPGEKPRSPSAPDHDAAEAEAMAEHYATPVGEPLPGTDPLAAGLLKGFYAHRRAKG
ncbi:hypothetical protein [Roseomonas mucosa]|uniref:hypothetical protein n=1 Tax=Roseomonas mucosa TaxID=207340 RepID=UPI00223EF59E|nr:hypothetical protein [Roseomonas mucosa]